MVESLRELNKICQKPRYREVGNWMVRYVLRDLALPFTWLLLHTPVTANQVTLFSLAVALLGMIFLALPGNGNFLAGVFLLQAWYLLDHVDGQIARYRKTASLTGRFFDFIMHHLVHGTLYFALGFYAYARFDQPSFLVWGFLASLAIIHFNLIHDTRCKTYVEKLGTVGTAGIKAKSSKPSRLTNSTPSWPQRIFSLLHKTCEIHVSMNLLTLAAIGQSVFRWPFDSRFLLLIYFGFVTPFLAVTKITHIIRHRKIDQDFQAEFEISGDAG